MKSPNALNLIFAGTPEFSATILQALLDSPHNIKAVYTQPDRPAGRGRKLTPSAVKQLALQHQLTVCQPETLRDPKEQAMIASLAADLMVVVAYGLILPADVLTMPRLGCINIHASLLPHWRGAAPIQRAILAGDKKTGITIMQMDAGLDTGPMLNHIECCIDENDTSLSLYDKLAKLGAEALLKTLAANKLQPQQQDNAQASYAHKILKEEAKIDWALSADEINCKIRAFNPWPIAETNIAGQVLRIWQAQVIKIVCVEQPGKIVSISRDGIDVATGDGILRLQKIQMPGGRVLSTTEIMNARRDDFFVNQIFG